jgi:hypothetical protein
MRDVATVDITVGEIVTPYGSAGLSTDDESQTPQGVFGPTLKAGRTPPAKADELMRAKIFVAAPSP